MPRDTAQQKTALPSDLTFEEAFKELESIIQKLEAADTVSLNDSITLYERGVFLRTYCEKILANAKLRIDKVTNGSPEGIEIESFDPRSV
ncbi:MAG: exodeoxyribonuclease VII small subunit [Alphaproteobacteria bacterium]|nr:MAG: exodeoxyribonuclease VII small subunit [Alphaproteobacteria bacterium]